MEAEIPASSLKAFYRVLQCLARIGDEVSIEARPEQVQLIGINASRSAYASFTFERKFFHEYRIATQPETASITTFQCKVYAKPLLAIFKPRGKGAFQSIEKCVLRIEQAEDPVHIGGRRSTPGSAEESFTNANGECRLVVQMTQRQGMCKTYRLFYEVCSTFHSMYDKDACKGHWQVSAKIAADWISHFFRGLEEITLAMAPNEIRVRSWADGQYAGVTKSQINTAIPEPTRTLQTELVVDPSEFDLYEPGITSNLLELTLGLREFKAILQYADAMSLSLAAHFDCGGSPIIFTASVPSSLPDADINRQYEHMQDDMSAEFVMATISDPDLSQWQSSNAEPSAEDTIHLKHQFTPTPIHSSNTSSQFQNPINTPLNTNLADDRIDVTMESGQNRNDVTQPLPQNYSDSIYDSVGRSINLHKPWDGIGTSDNSSSNSNILIRTPTHSTTQQQTNITSQNARGVNIDIGSSSLCRPRYDRTTTLGERSYPLLDMPRPSAPPGVTDSQASEKKRSETKDDSGAPFGYKQTKLSYAKATTSDTDGSDTEMSNDEELDATPPPPSKRLRSLF